MRNEICHVKFKYFSHIHIKGNPLHVHIIKTLIPVKFCEAEGYFIKKRAQFGSTVFFVRIRILRLYEEQLTDQKYEK